MRRFPLCTAVVSTLAACVGLPGLRPLEPSDRSIVVRAVRTEPRVRLPRICPRGVALHSIFDSVPAGYREIARLTASGDWDAVTNTALYHAQRDEAARLGANAIIVDRLDEASPLGKLVEIRTGWIAQRRATATAVYIAADSQRVRLACPSKARASAAPAGPRHRLL